MFSHNIEQYSTQKKCDICAGSRLRKKTSEKEIIKGFSVGDLYKEDFDNLEKKFQSLKEKTNKKLKSSIDNILIFIRVSQKVGLGYLKLSQKVMKLSGGENQRIKLAEALNDNRYAFIVLDEPAKGLGKREIKRLIKLLYEYIIKNNKTFIVAEHDPIFLGFCSYFVDLKRIAKNTTIVFQGNREELFKDQNNDIKKWIVENSEKIKLNYK